MKNKLIFILSILTFISCDTASVDLDDENYIFDGRGGAKCEVNVSGIYTESSYITRRQLNGIEFRTG